MPDGNQGGLQGVYNENLTPGQQAPPSNSGLLPGSTAAPTPAQPPDYKALGAGQAKADFAAASGNGSWEFDPEAMDKVIQQLDDTVQGDYTTAANEADYLAGIQPPEKRSAARSMRLRQTSPDDPINSFWHQRSNTLRRTATR